MRLRFKLVDFNIAVTSEINLCDVLGETKLTPSEIHSGRGLKAKGQF